MNIVEYSPAHRPAILQALADLQRHEHALSNTRKPPSSKLCERYFKIMTDKAQTQQGKTFVCLDGQDFAGFVSYHMENDDTPLEEECSRNHALISDIYVAPPFRKRGVAQKLMDAVANDLRAKKFGGRLRICSLSNNGLAISAYERHGFKPYETTYEKQIDAP